MIGTIFAILLAILISFYPGLNSPVEISFQLSLLITITATIFIIVIPLMNTINVSSLQKFGFKTTPYAVTLSRQDRRIHLINCLLFSFVLFSYVLAIALLFPLHVNKIILFAFWIILLGLSFDLLRIFFKHSLTRIDPYVSVENIATKAKQNIKNEHYEDLLDCVEALTETSINSLERNSLGISYKALNEMQAIVHNFLVWSKSISYTSEDDKIKKITGQDEISFTLFFILQRLEIIFQKALSKHLEVVCSHVIITLGKIIINAAKLDLSLTALPLHFLGKFIAQAQKENFDEISVKAEITLLEVSKSIINEVDITYAELQPPFFKIINLLEKISKEMFRKDKTTNLQLLTQPLIDLKNLFTQSEKCQSHQDTPIIIQEIDRVLNEFDALNAVLRSMPPIPNFSESKEELK